MVQRESDVVESLQQAGASEGIDLKWLGKSRGVCHGAGVEIDPQCVGATAAGCGLRRATKQFFHILFVEPDRQHAVLETVGVEDVGEGGGNDNPKPIIGQRPRGVLPARTAAEIAPRQQNARPGSLRPIQFELRLRRPIGAESPVEKQKLPKAGALNPLEKLLGNDLIGIDVGPVTKGFMSGTAILGYR